MDTKHQILIVLQNFYIGPGKRRKLKFPIYDTRIINRKNATYSRIVPYLEEHFELFFTECTPMIGENHKEKFPTDLAWLNQAITDREWGAIFVFGEQAKIACQDLGFLKAIFLPHPVSFKWRKTIILEAIEQLLLKIKQNSDNNEDVVI